MRYNDWDVLLFPAGQARGYNNKTPFKEFGVGCQVIPDVEQAHCQGSVGLPIVTCFVPSIQPGAPFQVSVHSWSEPEITQYTKSYSKHVELVQFEARVFIDGQLVASSIFNRKNREWPHIIDTTLELSKSGELALLKFPAFKKELLTQSTWSPGDDTGRIKLVISEGFPRDSISMPIERVKNVVAFSFQHAPLDVLEAKGIAWPNPSMWRSGFPLTHSGPQSHAHSPRHAEMRRQIQATPCQMPFPSGLGFASGPSGGSFGMAAPDSLQDVAYYNDILMPTSFSSDFAGKAMWPTLGLNGPGMMGNFGAGPMRTDYITQVGTCAPCEGEPMHLSGPSLEDDEPMSLSNDYSKAPTNTPTTGTNMNSSVIASDFTHTLTNSLLNQPLPIIQPQNIPLPASEIKSRKERDTRFLTLHGSNPASALSTPQGVQPEIRKFSQPLFTPAPGIFNSTTTSTSPATQPISSASTSRNTSNTDSGSTHATFGSVSTPSALRNSSAASLNAVAMGSGRKRNRNFTPASAKAIDDEDQPLRPSPHLRTNFAMVEDDESDQ